MLREPEGVAGESATTSSAPGAGPREAWVCVDGASPLQPDTRMLANSAPATASRTIDRPIGPRYDTSTDVRLPPDEGWIARERERLYASPAMDESQTSRASSIFSALAAAN